MWIDYDSDMDYHYGMSNQKPILKTESIPYKEYRYQLDPVKLSFNLRQDVKIELVAFKKVLEQALWDVSEDLKKFKD